MFVGINLKYKVIRSKQTMCTKTNSLKLIHLTEIDQHARDKDLVWLGFA